MLQVRPLSSDQVHILIVQGTDPDTSDYRICLRELYLQGLGGSYFLDPNDNNNNNYRIRQDLSVSVYEQSCRG